MARTTFQSFGMSDSTQGDQGGWLAADLDPEERKFELPELTDETPIVRYVRLSTLFLYLSNRALIPSLECLQRLDDLEGRLPFPVPRRIHEFVGHLFGRFRNYLAGQRTPRRPGQSQHSQSPKRTAGSKPIPTYIFISFPPTAPGLTRLNAGLAS
jgi:hypothetical protein